MFATSLYKIKQIVTDQTEESNPEPAEALSFPPEYTEFTDIVSKEALNTLPLHRPYDHKIELEKLNTLSYSPLYKMTT